MNDIEHPVAKAMTGLTLFFFIDWFTTVGKVCGAATAIWIFSRMAWDSALRPIAVQRGWIKPKTHWVED